MTSPGNLSSSALPDGSAFLRPPSILYSSMHILSYRQKFVKPFFLFCQYKATFEDYKDIGKMSMFITCV